MARNILDMKRKLTKASVATAVASALFATTVNITPAVASTDAHIEVESQPSPIVSNAISSQSDDLLLEFAKLYPVHEPGSLHHGERFDLESSRVQPNFAWGAVFRVLLSKPACEAARAFYNNQFPDKPKLKCRKRGKVWVLTR
ncbi:hypothetical protein SAMN05421878_11137 [Actinobaculum suis]|uniref:Uncharacterized protein n=1 Tax=Actinobaculum suis TaxID=1657 RepID=A0A1G7DHC4_9ACTO|nr:hypothetical protein [Actinobaculum suis]SDE50907.1 hypothetical protein SAMN05421878_11137 [Actinobaculum suis]VDG76990.1 Uncharacterised protein [Actinobaculum suis]